VAQFDIGTLRKTFGVTMERTARELRGISCIDFSEGPPPKEAICSSKMFGVRQTELSPIREAMAAYVSRAAEKLRAQNSLCSTIQVGLQTQLADREGPRYANAVTMALPAPTDDTREILALAQRGLGQIYRPGYPFSKCSILLMDLSQRGELTPDLFAPKPRPGADQLMKAVDQINQREGRGAVRIGRVPAKPKWAMRREMLSQRYTTRWEEVIGVRG
jgi:DNA polymerase V